MTNAVDIAQTGTISSSWRNRIINGGMTIDQRNAGASVTPAANNYLLDRWVAALSQSSKYSVQQNAGSITPPVGFTNYLGVTSLSAYSITSSDYFAVSQRIEGLNVSDLGWGTANAATITVSFWVYSSLTGLFGGSVANNATNRSYPFSYTINAANTWEIKSITIPGDTSGTWLTTNGRGLILSFSLGMGSTYSGTSGVWASANYLSVTGAVSVVGTSGATFYITGVQLEKGTAASPFDYRDYGRELIMCQRYYNKSYLQSVVPGTASQQGGAYMCPYMPSGNTLRGTIFFKVGMRAAPTVTVYNPETGTAGFWGLEGGGSTNQATAGVTFISENGALVFSTSSVAGIFYFQWRAEIEL